MPTPRVIVAAAIALFSAATTSCSTTEPGNFPQLKPAILPICAGPPSVERAPECISRRKPEAIQAELRSHYGRIRHCYNEIALRHSAHAAGRVLTRFRVTEDGAVTGACVVESEIDDEEFLQCVAQAVSNQELSPNSAYGCGDVKVTYPLIFSNP